MVAAHPSDSRAQRDTEPLIIGAVGDYLACDLAPAVIDLGGARRLVLAVADTEAEAFLLRPRAWLTAALQDSGVELVRVSIDDAARSRVVEAQRAQFR